MRSTRHGAGGSPYARRGVRLLPALVLLLPVLARAPAAAACERLALGPVLETLVPPIESFELDNGLRFVIAPRAGRPSATVRVTYDVGARDEPVGRSGLAHLFEHVMFKGSASIPDGGHFRLVRDVGGRVNAQTDYDLTDYWNTVPATDLDRVLEAEADRMPGLRISRAGLDNQREAIQEETALRIGNVPYAAAATDLLAQLWAGTPYGHSPIGSDEELAAASEAEARAFHATYYTPNNAVVVVAGGVEVAAARRAVEAAFSGVARGETRPRLPGFEVDRRARHERVADPLAPFPVYALVWHGVGQGHPDAPALAILDELLLGHRDARLSRALRGTYLFDAYSLSLAFRDVGLVNFVFAPRTFASFDEIRAVVREEVVALREHGPDPGELCRALRHEQLERLALLGTNEGLSAVLARGVLFHGDPERFVRDLHALGDLSVAEVREVAVRTLGEPTTLEIVPTGVMRWLKPVLEVLPRGVGASLESWLL